MPNQEPVAREPASTVRPLLDPRVAIDVRSILARELEREIGLRCGGNAVLNRLEAEAWADRLTMRGTLQRPAETQQSSGGHDGTVHSNHHLR